MSLDRYLSDAGIDVSRPSVRLYVEQFMKSESKPESKPKCSATSPPDFTCTREHGHDPKARHCWAKSKREVKA